MPSISRNLGLVSLPAVLGRALRKDELSRTGIGVLTNGLTSIISLVIAIYISHSSGIEGLGEYGLTFAVYGLTLGVAGAVGAMSVLSLSPDAEMIRSFGSRVSLVGLVGAGVTLTAAAVGQSLYLVVLGVCLHGMLLHDFEKKIKTAIGKGLHALLAEGIIFFLVLATAAVVILAELPTIYVFASWCGASLVSGYGQALRDSLKIMPGWKTNASESRSALMFGLENLSGAGAGHLLIALVSVLFGMQTVGALRGAATILGPANLVSTTVQSLVLPALARARKGTIKTEIRSITFIGVTVPAVVGGLAFPLLLLSDELGTLLLSTAWRNVELVLLALALECTATAVSVIAIAGHRVYGQAGRLMSLSMLLIPLRVAATLLGGFIDGPQGVAAGMASIAVIGAAGYWISYVQLVHREVRQKPASDFVQKHSVPADKD